MDDEKMCYVAADPEQPGAAWAVAVDEPGCAKYNARDIARWLKSGATVMRVPAQTARNMLIDWARSTAREGNK